MNNIVIRADSSYDIGIGHIMRDLVLAKQYENANIIFATLDLNGNINSKIIDSGYRVHILKSDDINELTEFLQKCKADLLIVDNYDIGYNQEKYIKDNLDIKILCLDDTYQQHYCDILLNHNIYADKQEYIGLVPKDCEIRCGIKYTLLRDEFLNMDKYPKTEKSVFKVFIAMGGADSKNINIDLLSVLDKTNIEIELVTTKANKNLPKLQKYIKKYQNINLIIDSNNIAEVISNCNIAIVTPSVMVNEIVFLNIPFISILVAENQKYMYNFLKNNNLPCIEKDELHKLNNLINNMREKDTYFNYKYIIKKIISKRFE